MPILPDEAIKLKHEEFDLSPMDAVIKKHQGRTEETANQKIR